MENCHIPLGFEGLSFCCLYGVAYATVSGAMDAFARGLRNATKLINDGHLASLVAVSLRIIFVDLFLYPVSESGAL